MAGLVPYWVHTPAGLRRMLFGQAALSTLSTLSIWSALEYPVSTLAMDARGDEATTQLLRSVRCSFARFASRGAAAISTARYPQPRPKHLRTKARAGAGAVGAGAALRRPLAVAAAARGNRRQSGARYVRVRVGHP